MNPLPRRRRKPATAANAQKRLEIVIHARNFGERRRISLKTPRFVVCFQGFGGMAEWLKAAVLKTVVPQGTVGSNPTSSARYVTGQAICLACFRLKGRRPSMERGNHTRRISPLQRKRIRGHWRGKAFGNRRAPSHLPRALWRARPLGATARHVRKRSRSR